MSALMIGEVDGAWAAGCHDDYYFEAKVFDEPSKYGIGGGRVSKLRVTDSKGQVVYDYDRGTPVVHFNPIGLVIAAALEAWVLDGRKP